jgi:ABC-type thiamin/hydroxymethylpyrimidine transport system permease subunit
MNAIHGHFHIIWYGMLWGMGADEGFFMFRYQYRLEACDP